MTPRSVAEPAKFRYEPALDGLRALAVLAVIAFHLDSSWARGAYLGVDLFFVLSGFLITTLLVIEWRGSDTIALRRFWSRRARRLLPAMLIVLTLVAAFTRYQVDPWNRAGIRTDGIASLFYVANWRFIAAKQGYFGLFSAASPLRHMWSLAIEEQFYVAWPLVVFAVLRVSRGSLRILAAVCALGIAASAAVMATSYGPGDPLRAYYGTDSRAHTILVGALLAVVLVSWTPGARARRRLSVAGMVAFGVMLVAWNLATGTSARYYHGGSLAYAVLACVVIAGARQPGVLRTALGMRPLAWLGRLSYGLYVFHWPLIVWFVPTRVHLHGLELNVLRVAATFAAALVSFHLVELPIRERRRPRLPTWRGTGPGHATRAPARSVARWLAVPAVVVTFGALEVSSLGAAPPPSYLSGSRTPTFSFPAFRPRATAGAGTRGARSVTRRVAVPTTLPHATNVTFAVPKIDFVWAFGDPLFCGDPRPDETRQAVDEARTLGAPRVGAAAPGLRVLVLGDSTACSIFPGLHALGDEIGASVAQASVFGCGVASGEITTTRGEQITPHTDRCPAMVAAAELPALAQMRPDVVVWMSLWEKSDVIANGTTLVSGTPAGDAEMLRRMNAALERITMYGARVVLATVAAPAPNDAEGAGSTTRAVDEAGYARLDAIDRRFAADHPGVVTLFDLAHRICPSGPPCPEQVGGVRMRPDGRHFSPTAASIAAQWLMPSVVAVAGRK